MKMTRYRNGAVLALSLMLALSACDIFDVESPGRIADDDLNDPDAAPGIVTGMSYDVAGATNSLNDLTALAAGELFHGGSYDWADIPRGIILPEDVNGTWGSLMQARYVTTSGVVRLQGMFTPEEFAKHPLVARAYLLGGFANRMVGENVCESVVEGGGAQPNTVEFENGITAFTNAIQIGTAAGSGSSDVVNAAYAGRASLKAWMGDWAGAVSDAQQVPIGFVYEASLMTDGLSNTLAYETHDRFEYTAFDTEFGEHPNDTRAPWDTVYYEDGSIANGANGQTPMFQQQKYTGGGDNIPLVKGTEMLILRAEAALRNNDIPGAFALINQERAHDGMPDLPIPGSLAEAWTTLHFERGAVTWLENRRLWDLRRWFAESGPAHHDFMSGRDSCIPISEEEINSNPNIP